MLRKYKPCIFDECTFSCEWWGGNQIFRNDGDIGKKKKKYLLKLNNKTFNSNINVQVKSYNKYHLLPIISRDCIKFRVLSAAAAKSLIKSFYW